jgi:hypothetical protein
MNTTTFTPASSSTPPTPRREPRVRHIHVQDHPRFHRRDRCPAYHCRMDRLLGTSARNLSARTRPRARRDAHRCSRITNIATAQHRRPNQPPAHRPGAYRALYRDPGTQDLGDRNPRGANRTAVSHRRGRQHRARSHRRRTSNPAHVRPRPSQRDTRGPTSSPSTGRCTPPSIGWTTSTPFPAVVQHDRPYWPAKSPTVPRPSPQLRHITESRGLHCGPIPAPFPQRRAQGHRAFPASP